MPDWSCSDAQIGNALGSQITEWLTRKVTEASDVIRSNAPVKTGDVRNKVSGNVQGSGIDQRGEIVLSSEHVRPVVFGSKAHVIRPRNAKVLRFESGGMTVYARKVNHPGTQPNPFLSDSLRQVFGG